jgi:hypothetical protein
MLNVQSGPMRKFVNEHGYSVVDKFRPRIETKSYRPATERLKA